MGFQDAQGFVQTDTLVAGNDTWGEEGIWVHTAAVINLLLSTGSVLERHKDAIQREKMLEVRLRKGRNEGHS